MSKPSRAPSPIRVADWLYQGEPKNGWLEVGAKPPRAKKGPAPILPDREQGFALEKKPGKAEDVDALIFRLSGAVQTETLSARLESSDYVVFPRIPLRGDHLRRLKSGAVEALIAFEELNPRHEPFERVVWSDSRVGAKPTVWIDEIGLTVPKGPDLKAVSAAAAGLVQALRIDCTGGTKPISSLIYGVNYYPVQPRDETPWSLYPTARRWGGNTTSRYNWQLGTVWNTGRDWFWENVQGEPYTFFLDQNAAHGVQTALTVPTIGWVAKDGTSFSFPISTRGPQQASDKQYRPDAGNGVDPSGKALSPPSPTQTSVPATPAFIASWVEAIRKRDASTGKRSVDVYVLDNEPALWHQTHRDVHPEPVGYDELLDRTLKYGAAIRAADAQARIAGPAAWGWPEMFYSAKDSSWGLKLRPDRRAHGDVPLLAWYLRRLREEEKRTKVHILDLVDVHFYPQAEGLYGVGAASDPSTAALRIRSTRGLWDGSYTDESYIAEPIRFLPRLKELIDQNFPGRGIMIGEWNFGGETHMSGGLAVAEALGRFGQHGVAAAYYWTWPPAGSPAAHAFLAYRNFDGKGGHFLEQSLSTVGTPTTSVFASKDREGSRIVAVILNLSPDRPLPAEIKLTACGEVKSRSTYVYAGGGATGFKAQEVVTDEGGLLREELAPYSMTVLDLKLVSPLSAPSGVP